MDSDSVLSTAEIALLCHLLRQLDGSRFWTHAQPLHDALWDASHDDGMPEIDDDHQSLLEASEEIVGEDDTSGSGSQLLEGW